MTSFPACPSAGLSASVAVAALIATSSCAAGDAATRPVARVDTLPSGIVQVTSEAPTGWSDSSRAWRLVEAMRIAPDDGTPGELVQPGTIGVDGAGRIYVVDEKPAIIKVYDSAGTFLRTIGGEGSGPGEFQVGFLAVRGGSVVVHDPRQSRTSVFDTAGTFITSWVSACCYWTDITIDDADRIYIPAAGNRAPGVPPRGSAYIRYRMDGTLIDSTWVPNREADTRSWVFVSKGSGQNRGMMSTSIPFAPRMIWTFHPEGGFVAAWTGEYRLIRSPSGHDTTAIYQRNWTADPVPESMRQREVNEMVRNASAMVGEDEARSVARLEHVPTTAPAFTTLRVDLEGNIWARHLIGSDSTATRYDVFGPDGSWLGQLTAPVAVPEWGGQLFGRGVIYTTAEGEDGRPVIVRLRVQRGD